MDPAKWRAAQRPGRARFVSAQNEWSLLHRRADLRETMSDYLIHELERYGVAVRDRSRIGDRLVARLTNSMMLTE